MTDSLSLPKGPQPSYEAPALEKGLDILECLASQGVPLTQAQLARALGRSPNEFFRMLVSLERRGYIQRDQASGAYALTLRLFTLSHTHSPAQGLKRAAARPMRELTHEVRESCHLSVIHRGELLVLAQEESPQKLRLSVEVGATFPLLHTVSGRLLLAHLAPDELEETLRANDEYAASAPEERATIGERLTLIRTRGYEEAYGETTEGVKDLAILVGVANAGIQAALTIASLGRKPRTRQDDLLPALRRCAETIGRTAGLIAHKEECT